MVKRTIWLIVLLVLGMVLVPLVFATQPAEIHGYFDAFDPLSDPVTYCLHTGEEYGTPDGFITGCVEQPVKPGLAQKGTFADWIDGIYGSCDYGLRTFELDGIARFSMHRCRDELKGFHMLGTGGTDGFWTGSYHQDP